MRKNVASQNVAGQMNSATDGSALTTGVSVFVTGDGGTQTAGGGTTTHKGNGHWNYAPTQAETNFDHIAFTFTHASGVNQTVNVYTISFNPHDTVRLGLTALPNAAAEAAGGLYTRGSGAGQINQSANGQIDVNVEQWRDAVPAALTANGYVQTMLLRWLTDNAAGTPNALVSNRVDTSVGAMAADVVTAAAIATDAIGAAEFAQGAADKVWSSATRTLTSFGFTVSSNLTQILGTALTETLAGYLAAAFKKFFDIAVPVFTTASVNQTGDSFVRLGAPVAASISADIANVQTDTDNIQTRLPAALTAAGNLKADVEEWRATVPGGLTVNGYVQTMLVRWVTDDANGTPFALIDNRVHANMGAISGDAAAADNLETMLDGTGGQVLSLKQLNVVNSTGTAIVAQSSGGGGSGIQVNGNTAGSGISIQGGATGKGLSINATTNEALSISSTNRDAIVIDAGSGSDPNAVGIEITGGIGLTIDSLNGNAINISALGVNGHALNLNGVGTGKSVNAPQDIAVSDGSLTLAAIADAAWDEVLTGATHNIPSSAGRRLRQLQPNDTALRSGTAQAGGVNTITLDAGASAADDFYNNTFVVLTGGTGSGQARLITDYVGGTKVATVDSDWSVQPDATTTFDVMPLGTVEVASIRSSERSALANVIWTNATRTLTSFGTLVTDIWANATRTLTSFGTLTADVADKILGRNLAGGADGGRTVRQALRILRNLRQIVAGVLTVMQEDDVTPDWTASVTQTPGDPVSKIDPT